ncbi:hypothetical protein Sjap_025807 [Stephania japonica]|uniref:FBD domain-containing protein n=1 Tax=Stephania japonica TaxID=461633 RepID=A0AAP0HIB1_9MAGN
MPRQDGVFTPTPPSIDVGLSQHLQQKVNIDELAIDVLQRLCNASNILTLQWFEISLERYSFGDALPLFTNLKSLELDTSIEEFGVILSKCSSIETLLFYSCSGLAKEKNEAEVVLPELCSLNNIKYVDVRKLSRGKTELQFLRFLLNNAKLLKLVTIDAGANSKYEKHEMNVDVPNDIARLCQVQIGLFWLV